MMDLWNIINDDDDDDENSEVAQPCKSPTCHSWPHFYGTGIFL